MRLYIVMNTKLGLTILLSLALLSCNNANSSRTRKKTQSDSTNFRMIEVPITIADPQERLDYSLDHFWDKLSPLCYSLQVEEQFANWIWITERADFNMAVKSLREAYTKDPKRILELARKYLYDPQSPYRNESLYGHLCEVAGDELAETAHDCLLNSVGTKAADFEIEDQRGRIFNLYSVEADYILLVFSNPMCTACKEIVETLTTEQFILDAISNGKLAVVDVYPDEELDEWRKTVKNYPNTWKIGFDPSFNLQNSKLYNIRAIPSLYLLDKDKTVILKDATFERIMRYLETIPQF